MPATNVVGCHCLRSLHPRVEGKPSAPRDAALAIICQVSDTGVVHSTEAVRDGRFIKYSERLMLARVLGLIVLIVATPIAPGAQSRGATENPNSAVPGNVVGLVGSVERNVIYGMVSGAALLLDVYRPAQSNGLGVLYLGGGGWASGPEYSAIALKDTAFVPLVNALAKAGYTVFAINYRTTPVFSYPEPLEDVRRAIRFVRHSASQYGIDPNRIGGFGGSAGGHLMALAALTADTGDAGDPDPINRQSTRIQAMALVAAPLDLLAPDFVGSAAMGAFMRMRPPVANAPATSGQVRLYRDASPITHISADDPPTILIHGDADKQVSLRQSQAFDTALRKANVPSKLVVVPGGDHGATFGLAAGVSRPPNWPDEIGEIVRWFDQHLKAARTGDTVTRP